MTEKRFTMKGSTILECGEEITAWDCCDLLNELHEENQSSKEFIEQLQEELVLFKKAGADMGNDLNAQITALKQENEKLKKRNKGLQSELHIFKEDVTHSNKIIDKLNDENEQLKKQIDELVQGIRDTAKISADAITKVWTGDDYD